MKIFRAFFGIAILAVGASLPWLVQDHLAVNSDRTEAKLAETSNSSGDSIGSKALVSVREWLTTPDPIPSQYGDADSTATPATPFVIASSSVATSARSKVAESRVTPLLEPELAKLGLKIGDPVFIRIFKEEADLELWMLGEGKNEYELFKTYKICAFSGKPGPKVKEGDRQAPEGFYFVPPSRMNPNSQFHLSFDLGFPNEYDRYHKRTGTFLMVHGDCVSAGCYAMTDVRIEEIYTLAATALEGGQKFFRVHAFPFQMTDERMNKELKKKGKWLDFWGNLKEGYDYFEMMKLPPNTEVKDGKYAISES